MECGFSYYKLTTILLKLRKKRWQQNNKRAKIILKTLLNNYQRISISRQLKFFGEIHFQFSIKNQIQNNKPNYTAYKCYFLYCWQCV